MARAMSLALFWVVVAAGATNPEADRLLREGQRLKQQGQLARATETLTAAVEWDNDLLDARWDLAWLLAAQKQAAAAAREFLAVVDLAPGTAREREARAALDRLKLSAADLPPDEPAPALTLAAEGDVSVPEGTWQLALRVTAVALPAGAVTGEVTALGAAAAEPAALPAPLPVTLLVGPGGRAAATGRVAAGFRPARLQPGETVRLRCEGPARGPLGMLPCDLQPGEAGEPAAGPRPDLVAFPAEPDSVTRAKVVVPLTFPAVGEVDWTDTFLASRGGGSRRHLGQDLMASKLTPCVAAFDGRVSFRRSDQPNASNSLYLVGDQGWRAFYVHLNNDTPGTDDGRGSPDYTFPAWLQPGDRVAAGELVAWVGDSGNAEATDPHLHFELWSEADNVVVNAAPSLRAAPRLSTPLAPPGPVELTPGPGEMRLDGAVLAFDPARGVLQLATRGRLTGSGRRTVEVRPRRDWAKLGCLTALRIAGLSEYGVALSELAPGQIVSLVGRMHGESLVARDAVVVRAGLVASPALAAALRGAAP